MKQLPLLLSVVAGLLATGCASLDRSPEVFNQPSVYGSPEPIAAAIRPPVKAATGLPTYSSPAAQRFAALSSDGRSNLAHGDAAAAEYSFSQALEVNPFDPIALNNLAVAKAERNQFYTALGLLERAAKLAPSNAEIAANLARMRLYVAEVATVGRDPLLPLGRVEDGLPPDAPALWDSTAPLNQVTPVGYYSSSGCKNRSKQPDSAACISEPAP